MTQWVGPRTQNPRVPGSIPGSRKSFWGHFLVMSGSLFHDFGDVLGCVWEYCGNVFGWFGMFFWKNIFELWGDSEGVKNVFFKSAWEYFPCIGLPLTIILGVFPKGNIQKMKICVFL